MTPQYDVTDLIVIHLRAGKDRNGNTRRCLVLAHPIDGFIDATDVGPEGPEHAVRDFEWFRERAVQGSAGATDLIARELAARVTTAIDTSPSYYRHMVTRKLVGAGRYDLVLGADHG